MHTQQNPGEPVWPYEGIEGMLALKGSLHNHTVTSDGPITPPAEVRRIYQDAGYHFAAVTDHDRRMHQVPWADEDYQITEPGVFVLFRGYEASFPNAHVNCLGCQPSDPSHGPGEPGFIDETRAAGALTWLNHPAKYNDCPNTVADDPELSRVHGVEVYSGARVAKSPGAFATAVWDACLARGLRLWALASADCHNYALDRPDSPFNGYVVAFASAVEHDAIMDALFAGRFYASTGVEVTRASYFDGRLDIESANADRVRFIGPAGVIQETDGPNSTCDLAGNGSYVRVELERDKPCFHTPDAPRQTAWLQPLWT